MTTLQTLLAFAFLWLGVTLVRDRDNKEICQ